MYTKYKMYICTKYTKCTRVKILLEYIIGVGTCPDSVGNKFSLMRVGGQSIEQEGWPYKLLFEKDLTYKCSIICINMRDYLSYFS